MASPSPQAIAWIRQTAAGLPGGLAGNPDDAAVAAALNAITAPNPVQARPEVPAPFQSDALFAAVSAANLQKILALPSFEAQIRPMLDAANPKDPATLSRLNQWAAGLTAAGLLAAGENQALAAEFAATAPDPAWTATLPAPLVALGRPVDAADIAAARAS